jgi:hypothetical protein
MKVSGQLHILAFLPPGKEPPVPTHYEANMDAVEKKNICSATK